MPALCLLHSASQPSSSVLLPLLHCCPGLRRKISHVPELLVALVYPATLFPRSVKRFAKILLRAALQLLAAMVLLAATLLLRSVAKILRHAAPHLRVALVVCAKLLQIRVAK